MALEGIRAVLLDFGGVVAEEGFRDGLRALAAEQGLDPGRVHREGMRAVYESGFVLGRGTAADFWTLLRRRTGLQGEDQALTERVLAGFRVRPGMLDLVGRLRAAGLVTGILSDQTHWLDTLDEGQPFKDTFDRVYNSYHLGKGKEDPTLFPEVAADLGLAPPEILFVDDAPGNVERARQAGFRGLLFKDEADFRAQAQSLLVSLDSE